MRPSSPPLLPPFRGLHGSGHALVAEQAAERQEYLKNPPLVVTDREWAPPHRKGFGLWKLLREGYPHQPGEEIPVPLAEHVHPRHQVGSHGNLALQESHRRLPPEACQRIVLSSLPHAAVPPEQPLALTTPPEQHPPHFPESSRMCRATLPQKITQGVLAL